MFDVLIVKPILNAIMLLYSVIPGGDFGIAIILFTILIRILIYPLVKKQLHQTKQMRKIQPALKKIKASANGNRQLEAMRMMELYKEYGIKPFQSILISLIQLPIFIGLYSVIQIIVLHRDQLAKYMYDFLENIGPIKQVIEHPEQFNQKMLGFIDLTKHAFSDGTINIILLTLAIISAITQYILIKQTAPQAPGGNRKVSDIMKDAANGKQADPADMTTAMTNGMMKFMPIMMFFIMVGLPGAIALYYTVSNLIAVAQQHVLLKDTKEELKEIAEKPTPNNHKKATLKAREKQAKEANITRIIAKDSGSKKGKK